MTTLKCTLCLYALLAASVAWTADDSTGVYFYGGGVGAAKCPTFVATMEKARTRGVMTAGFWRDTSEYMMYVLGFETAYNMSTPDTYDIFPHQQGYSLLSWIENYCRANASANFADGTVALAEHLYADRQRTGPQKH